MPFDQVVSELQTELSRLSEDVGARNAECVGLRTENVKLRMEVRRVGNSEGRVGARSYAVN